MARSHRPEDRRPPTPGEVVELRVHGVGGATPEELLDVPVTELVAGDESAGFFRPWLARDGAAPTLEGYSWGGLTSASRLRALWVLLSPFALANLAGWMLRHGGEPTDVTVRAREGSESLGAGLIRLFGLALTVATAAYVTVAAVDLVAFQCGAAPTCVAGRWWLSPWENRWVGDSQGRLVVVGAAVAMAAMLGVAWLARRSQMAIHERRAGFSGTGDPVFRLNLQHRDLWDSPHVAHRLGLTHSAAALAVVGVTLAVVGERAGIPGSPVTIGWLVLAAAATAVLRLEGVPAAVHLGLLGVAVGHSGWAAILLWGRSELATVDAPLPGADAVPASMLPVQPLLALAAGLVAYRLWRHHRSGRVRVALVPPALLVAAAGMIHAFGSGLTIRLADLLGSPGPASSVEASAGTRILYADTIGDTAVVTVFAILVLAAVVIAVWLQAGQGPTCETLAGRYADRGGLDCDDHDDREWARRVGKAEAVATLTDRAAFVVATVTTIVLVGVALAVLTGDDPTGMRLGEWAEPVAGPSSVILGLLPIVAVFGISRLYRSQAVRRVVGIMWDVATFWPRWFHPWSPPSYGERAVPQLGARLSGLARSGGVVLSAHSQGSVLALATLLLADDEVAERTALLTHGSPLGRLYAHYFPEYVSRDLMTSLVARIAAWTNLWRITDFIGGPVDAPGVADREVFDPPSSRPTTPGDPRPLPRRHSDYDRIDEYREARSELAATLGFRA